MSLVKEEYQSLLALLGRVETKGIAEAQALVALAQKLDSRIKTWYDGHVTGFKQDTAAVSKEVATEVAGIKQDVAVAGEIAKQAEKLL